MARGQSGGGNNLLVREAGQALNRMKYEIAAELGLPVSSDGAFASDVEFAEEFGTNSPVSRREPYWGHLASRDAGAVGGQIVKRLVEQAERALFT